MGFAAGDSVTWGDEIRHFGKVLRVLPDGNIDAIEDGPAWRQWRLSAHLVRRL
jgi:hypothetical protein